MQELPQMRARLTTAELNQFMHKAFSVPLSLSLTRARTPFFSLSIQMGPNWSQGPYEALMRPPLLLPILRSALSREPQIIFRGGKTCVDQFLRRRKQKNPAQKESFCHLLKKKRGLLRHLPLERLNQFIGQKLDAKIRQLGLLTLCQA